MQYQRRAASPDKLAVLDDKCRALCISGLCHYQGKGFAEIYQQERESMKSEHTLVKHLGHLIGAGLVKRIPKEGGPGRRGKYFFFQPPNPSGKRPHKKAMEALARGLSDYLPPIDALPQVQAEALADLLESLYLIFGRSLADLLEKALFQTNRRKAIHDFIPGSRSLDEAMDDMALHLLLTRPKGARQAVKIFRERLDEGSVLLGSTTTRAASERAPAEREKAERAAARRKKVRAGGMT